MVPPLVGVFGLYSSLCIVFGFHKHSVTFDTKEAGYTEICSRRTCASKLCPSECIQYFFSAAVKQLKKFLVL